MPSQEGCNSSGWTSTTNQRSPKVKGTFPTGTLQDPYRLLWIHKILVLLTAVRISLLVTMGKFLQGCEMFSSCMFDPGPLSRPLDQQGHAPLLIAFLSGNSPDLQNWDSHQTLG